MPIKNYTTEVDEQRTVGQIQGLLAGKGAKSISVEYTLGQPQAISFVIELDGAPVPFKLPCNFEGVRKAILGGYKDANARRRAERNPQFVAQTRRIAWRIIKDWVDAQLAVIEANQAGMAEVFLPYVVSNEGKTLYSHWRETMLPGDRQLKEGKS